MAAGVALSVAELVAGIWHRRPSLVTAVAQQVIDRAPTVFVRFGVERLGTGDKPSLIAGTIVLSLLIGAEAGTFARRRRVVGDAVFVAFAGLGFAAAVDAPGSSVLAAAFAAVCAAVAGAFSLRTMLAWASERPAAEPGVRSVRFLRAEPHPQLQRAAAAGFSPSAAALRRPRSCRATSGGCSSTG